MRKDLEEAFGIDKITTLENKVKELELVKRDLEGDIKVSEQVQLEQEKALGQG